MPKSQHAQGLKSVTLESARLCGRGFTGCRLSLRPASSNAETAQTRAQTRRTRKIQVRAAHRFDYADFTVNQAQRVAIRDHFTALAGAAS